MSCFLLISKSFCVCVIYFTLIQPRLFKVTAAANDSFSIRLFCFNLAVYFSSSVHLRHGHGACSVSRVSFESSKMLFHQKPQSPGLGTDTVLGTLLPQLVQFYPCRAAADTANPQAGALQRNFPSVRPTQHNLSLGYLCRHSSMC